MIELGRQDVGDGAEGQFNVVLLLEPVADVFMSNLEVLRLVISANGFFLGNRNF